MDVRLIFNKRYNYLALNIENSLISAGDWEILNAALKHAADRANDR